jgi:hypothetical protein
MNRKSQIKFLIHCLGFKKENDHPIHFEELKEKDWSTIFNKAQQHSIAPLLYYHIKQSNVQIPAHVLEQLNKSYFKSLLRNTYIYNELSKILNNAKEYNIPIVVLKGADLAESVYPGIALRPMKDLDLYIKIEDVQKVNDLLTQLGWKGKQKPEDIDHILKTEYSLKYDRSGLQIDLHLRVPELSDLSIWANVTSSKIGLMDTLVLKPEILLVFLCYHFYEHTRGELIAEIIKFYDIILVLRKYKEDISWDYFIQMAFTDKCENIICHVLEVINSEFGEDIPVSVLNKLRSTKYTVQIRKGLYNTPSDFVYALYPIRKIVLALYLHWFDPKDNSISYIIKTIFESIFPNKEFIIERYSPKKSWFFLVYYPVYFVTGVKNFFGILLKMIFNRKS